MRRLRKTKSAGHSAFLRATRTIVLGLPGSAKLPRAGSRAAKLRAAAARRTYLGLVIGLGLGIVLLALLLAEE